MTYQRSLFATCTKCCKRVRGNFSKRDVPTDCGTGVYINLPAYFCEHCSELVVVPGNLDMGSHYVPYEE